MTQEEKQLLIKDLCERLPYGVKGLALGGRDDTINVIVPTEHPWVKTTTGLVCHLNNGQFKPYLRPLSTMTEEEENEWCGFNIDPLLEAVGKPHTRIEDLMLRAKSQYDPLDWLNAHHFDYRGLIEKGLALEAPEGMYKTE